MTDTAVRHPAAGPCASGWRSAVAAVLVLAAGCGGGSPTAPGPAPDLPPDEPAGLAARTGRDLPPDELTGEVAEHLEVERLRRAARREAGHGRAGRPPLRPGRREPQHPEGGGRVPEQVAGRADARAHLGARVRRRRSQPRPGARAPGGRDDDIPPPRGDGGLRRDRPPPRGSKAHRRMWRAGGGPQLGLRPGGRPQTPARRSPAPLLPRLLPGDRHPRGVLLVHARGRPARLDPLDDRGRNGALRGPHASERPLWPGIVRDPNRRRRCGSARAHRISGCSRTGTAFRGARHRFRMPPGRPAVAPRPPERWWRSGRRGGGRERPPTAAWPHRHR